MIGTALFILFAIVYALCWTLNRFFLARKVNPGYIYLALSALLLLNQVRLAIVHGAGAYVFGTIFGTWLIPTVLAYFIARKFARDNPGSVPWGAANAQPTETTGSPTKVEPSWMKD